MVWTSPTVTVSGAGCSKQQRCLGRLQGVLCRCHCRLCRLVHQGTVLKSLALILAFIFKVWGVLSVTPMIAKHAMDAAGQSVEQGVCDLVATEEWTG